MRAAAAPRPRSVSLKQRTTRQQRALRASHALACELQPQSLMALWLRALVWIAVVVLPGGLLLLPLLLADAVRRRQLERAAG